MCVRFMVASAIIVAVGLSSRMDDKIELAIAATERLILGVSCSKYLGLVSNCGIPSACASKYVMISYGTTFACVSLAVVVCSNVFPYCRAIFNRFWSV